jgi:hypothetical protein
LFLCLLQRPAQVFDFYLSTFWDLPSNTWFCSGDPLNLQLCLKFFPVQNFQVRGLLFVFTSSSLLLQRLWAALLAFTRFLTARVNHIFTVTSQFQLGYFQSASCYLLFPCL